VDGYVSGILQVEGDRAPERITTSSKGAGCGGGYCTGRLATKKTRGKLLKPRTGTGPHSSGGRIEFDSRGGRREHKEKRRRKAMRGPAHFQGKEISETFMGKGDGGRGGQ